MHLSTLVEIAADLRRRAGQLTPPFSTHRIIETAFPNALVTGGSLPPGIDEIVSVRSDGPVIIYSRALSGPSQRYAIGHALAHLLFDDETACARAGCVGVAENEKRCDLFSAELLAPVTSVRRFVRHRPVDDEGEDREIYLDHVDVVASIFAMPAAVIDSQIRRVVAVDKTVKRCG